jgi:hypothetical protein
MFSLNLGQSMQQRPRWLIEMAGLLKSSIRQTLPKVELYHPGVSMAGLAYDDISQSDIDIAWDSTPDTDEETIFNIRKMASHFSSDGGGRGKAGLTSREASNYHIVTVDSAAGILRVNLSLY